MGMSEKIFTLEDSSYDMDMILLGQSKQIGPLFHRAHQVEKNGKMVNVADGLWEDTIVHRLKHLVDDILDWTPEEAWERLSYETLCEYGFNKILSSSCYDKPKWVLDEDYPHYLLSQAYPQIFGNFLQNRYVIVCYNRIKAGTLKAFPAAIFSGLDGIRCFYDCIRYLMDVNYISDTVCDRYLWALDASRFNDFLKVNGIKTQYEKVLCHQLHENKTETPIWLVHKTTPDEQKDYLLYDACRFALACK